MHDRLLKCGDKRISKNPPGFLAAAIRDDYRPPSSFNVDKAVRPQRTLERETKSAAACAASPEQGRLDDARRHFQSLSLDEQSNLEMLAVEKGNRFRVDTYNRLKASGGNLWEEIRDLLVADLLDVTLQKSSLKAGNGSI